MFLRYPTESMHPGWRYPIAAALAALPLAVCAQMSQLPDEACRQEVDRVAQRCEGTAIIKQCWRERLSRGCFKEVETGTAAKAPSCKKELQQVAGPCQEASRSFSKQCVEQNLSPTCKERVAKFELGRKACEEEVQRVWHLCKAEPQAEKQAQCFERHRAAARSVCE